MGEEGWEVAILIYKKNGEGLGAWYKTFVPAVDMVGAAMLVRSFLETHTKKKKKRRRHTIMHFFH